MDHILWDDYRSRLVWCVLTIKSSPYWWICRRRRKTIGGIITKDHDWYDVYGGLRRSTLVTEACQSQSRQITLDRPHQQCCIGDGCGCSVCACVFDFFCLCVYLCLCICVFVLVCLEAVLWRAFISIRRWMWLQPKTLQCACIAPPFHQSATLSSAKITAHDQGCIVSQVHKNIHIKSWNHPDQKVLRKSWNSAVFTKVLPF